ncbi:Hsp20/alpha crystallin family protein [Bacillus sp. FJAT-47783]|uniref:Hsp20/alpha crystallin family protein n=1 Tax=Bacillus sp. FJAT-47783 TaxID=2922712 RepID=UPI001FAE0A91|nr:Hsp20/alpha crystallin family protein [Bacillus sp. FJAT-47783]
MPEEFRKEPVGPMKLVNDFFTKHPQRTLLTEIDHFFRDKLVEPFFPVQTYETSTHFLVTAELPGIPKEDINVKVIGNELMISVKKGKKEEYLTKRKIRGAKRTIELPTHVVNQNMKATYKDGVLKIRLRKKRGKSIEIE